MSNRTIGAAAAFSLAFWGVAANAVAEEAQPPGFSLNRSPCREAEGCEHFQGYIYVHHGAPRAPSAAFFERSQGGSGSEDHIFVHLGDAGLR
jgi:hypothetical protein